VSQRSRRNSLLRQRVDDEWAERCDHDVCYREAYLFSRDEECGRARKHNEGEAGVAESSGWGAGLWGDERT
jgi:hypothetical protein